MTIVPVVEGHGEVEAVPVLIRRIAERMGVVARVAPPIRVKRSKLAKESELERTIELAARIGGVDGSILVLLDADEDLPCRLAPRLLERARAARSDRRIRIVLARTEFEAWFIAAAPSIAGKRGLASPLAPATDAEAIRDAKGWLSQRMLSPHRYRETIDQAKLAAVFDLDLARIHSPSFDKFWRDTEDLLRGG
ncbi:MAG: DUF4276 family protein [Planctomycetes bacterium]|nr:DUF4276 family protein [Planctomycetota bacterium]